MHFFIFLTTLICVCLPAGVWGRTTRYNIGTGIGDITGPISQIPLMGYADFQQVGKGLLQRVYARAFVVQDIVSRKHIAFVNTDTQSMGDIVKVRVVKQLQELYGPDVYTTDNVMLSSTHTHSSMGGYLQYTLFEIPVRGWIEETVKPMVSGIVKSIVQAHDRLQEGDIRLTEGELLHTNINRSPAAYLLNPAEERAAFEHDVDKLMTLLAFRGHNGTDLGLVSWFAVHGVSVNNTNHLINGDNKGYAAYAAEKHFNPDHPAGTGPFVAGFAQANEGDVSPNTLGPFCEGTDIPCDGSLDQPCPGSSQCIASGPAGRGESHYESNRIIGQNQADMAIQLFMQDGVSLDGPVDYRHKYWDITKEQVRTPAGDIVTPCPPAMGYAFGAGTTDGPAMRWLHQNMTYETPFWELAKLVLLQRPSQKQKACHAPKPILLNSGEFSIPYDWQPRILDVQLLRVGNVFIAGVPAEFTTMSGRRLRKAIKATLVKHYGEDVGADITVILSGPANGYASYVATYEEYQMQRFEGGGTAYGPYTLDAYIQVFQELAESMVKGVSVDSEELPDYTGKALNLAPYQGADRPRLFHGYGSVLRDVDSVVEREAIASAMFVAGNPRNHGQDTYLTVEQKMPNGEWKVIRNDHDYDTRFHWRYTNTLLGQSAATVEWAVPEDMPGGTYRLGYFGHHKDFWSRKVSPHQGYSSEFTIPDPRTEAAFSGWSSWFQHVFSRH